MEVLRKYGVQTTILFPLIDAGAQDFEATPVSHAAGDTQISKDEGAFANTSNAFAHEGKGIYSIVLTATEMQAARIVVVIVDSATKAWEDQAVVISTYGNASGQHAFDLDTATQSVNVTQVSGDSTAADNIEADYDGTGYNKSNSTIGTCTTNTDMVAAAPTAASVADAVWDEATSGHTTAGTFGEQVKTDIDAILVDTSTTLDGKINTIDTVVDAILVDTSTTLDGKIDTIDTNVDAILADTGTDGVVVAGTPDVNVAQISGNATAADNLEESTLGIVVGQAQTGTLTTTVMTTNLAEGTNDHYNGRVVVFVAGTLAGQAAEITDYSGTNGTITMTAITEAPSNGQKFVIV